jgi:hypothetical protein
MSTLERTQWVKGRAIAPKKKTIDFDHDHNQRIVICEWLRVGMHTRTWEGKAPIKTDGFSFSHFSFKIHYVVKLREIVNKESIKWKGDRTAIKSAQRPYSRTK